MLMDGSYLKDMEHILDKVRLVRRTLIQEGKLSVNAKSTQFILSAATIPTYGVKSTKNLIKKAFPQVVYIFTSFVMPIVSYVIFIVGHRIEDR